MKVFADFHHDDLFNSFHLLFEKRLGWELYAPAGIDWYVKGYWGYSPEPRLVDKYLGSGKKFEDVGEYSLMENPAHEKNIKALTFNQFKEMDIDIIISSVPEHLHIYQKLIKDHKPKAKLIQQVGNEWKKFNYGVCRNLMVSCSPFKIPSDVNSVFYHQEFDLDLFNYTPGNSSWPIKSFVNELPDLKDWGLFQRYEKRLKNWNWLSHGLRCRDGDVSPLKNLVRTMKDSSFIFHAKSLGDGFGHVIHNIFALGRPGIIRSHWYKGRLAEALIEDGVTCIDLDKRVFDANISEIVRVSEPDEYKLMCENARKRFEEVVNYDQEFFKIKNFLRRLQ